MNSNCISLFYVLALGACATTPTPSPEAAVPVAETPTPALSILGTWSEKESGESYEFLEDGTLKSPITLKSAEESIALCSEAGFDVSSCSPPAFKWLGHPSDNSRYLLAMSMPLMSRDQETQELQCFCPPQPGLPFSALLSEEGLVLTALQPNGAPIPGGSFTLVR